MNNNLEKKLMKSYEKQFGKISYQILWITICKKKTYEFLRITLWEKNLIKSYE